MFRGQKSFSLQKRSAASEPLPCILLSPPSKHSSGGCGGLLSWLPSKLLMHVTTP